MDVMSSLVKRPVETDLACVAAIDVDRGARNAVDVLIRWCLKTHRLDLPPRGFITKDSGATLLLEAVRAAASGDALVSPDITLRLIQQVTRRHRRGKPDRTLSTRELALLRAVASGLTNEEIAASLFLSLSTVKSGITSLLTHIGARNRVELTIYAYEHGIVEDQL